MPFLVFFCALVLGALPALAGWESSTKQTEPFSNRAEAVAATDQLVSEIKEGTHKLIHCRKVGGYEIKSAQIQSILLPKESGYQEAFVGNVTYGVRCSDNKGRRSFK
ncbi:MAG: hypothetical protein A2600_06355 [Candidatus Lambdaproteobacteria bacterium RIFOXYD1_FULL_56_27]|uniref:Uncharacterized protein n=1 Tax=Candidatus Lambdaproteobacteria bacterium RIFOXYD2_FULL_56_26 TaxID=1817773 RepID=A0A1F6H0I4_9PROT|nr:MAG: hypothetical protein A2426_00955 [Candidatus Lambdaproteobacteria bacterium RIFOXYC1_FULL_56_13]OGH03831.1 MAG: hypothetical protein A2557_11865 [Candidatus Lambdaproteobacteria bacterium RIFOXYD2_FULL_56_26]OGH08959.1 MAG: hypothetical protein A2600_06355 [Candidatus Lambdaproteobacteria bacterium RIFOXYD1_FULL_56_27]